MKQLESLAAAQCTDDEMAAHVGVSRQHWIKIKRRPENDEVIRRGRAKGLGSLRSAQFKAALEGNPTMLIWMGKQLLGQTDYERSEVRLTGPNGGAVQIATLQLESLSVEELQELYRLRKKIEPPIETEAEKCE